MLQVDWLEVVHLNVFHAIMAYKIKKLKILHRHLIKKISLRGDVFGAFKHCTYTFQTIGKDTFNALSFLIHFAFVELASTF